MRRDGRLFAREPGRVVRREPVDLNTLAAEGDVLGARYGLPARREADLLAEDQLGTDDEDLFVDGDDGDVPFHADALDGVDDPADRHALDLDGLAPAGGVDGLGHRVRDRPRDNALAVADDAVDAEPFFDLGEDDRRLSAEVRERDVDEQGAVGGLSSQSGRHLQQPPVGEPDAEALIGTAVENAGATVPVVDDRVRGHRVTC